MLEGLKRLFSASPQAVGRDWAGIEDWANAKHHTFRAVPNEGFVIDGRQGTVAWRLEWGPSQRPYIVGQELRLRAELGLTPELQLVVMNRLLQEAMEKAVFEQYVEGVQTRIDNQTPPEMRWLVMFPRLSDTEMGSLAEHFVALSSIKAWLLSWLEGPLMQALEAARLDPLTPTVMMIGRGRLMLRTSLPETSLRERTLQGWLTLFETAMRESRRVAAVGQEMPANVWSSSALPGDEHK
jgi:hypothetical protein